MMLFITIYAVYVLTAALSIKMHGKVLGKRLHITLQAANILCAILFILRFTGTFPEQVPVEAIGKTAFFWFFISSQIIVFTLIFRILALVLEKLVFRKKRFTKFFTLAVLLCTTGSAVYGTFNFNRIRVAGLHMHDGWTMHAKKCDMRQHDTEKFRIVFISDVHLGSEIGREALKKYVREINALQPDMILFGGDLLDRGAEIPLRERCDSIIRKLNAPSGIYGVYGNHESYTADAQLVEDFYRLSGITVLKNDTITVNTARRKIIIAGADDRNGYIPFSPAAESAETYVSESEMMPVYIAIKHKPDMMDDFSDAGYTLSLSGHTHNGQFFPGNILVRLANKYNYGLYRPGNSSGKNGCNAGYVSSGLGLWGPHLRTAGHSEIVCIDIF